MLKCETNLCDMHVLIGHFQSSEGHGFITKFINNSIKMISRKKD